MILCVPMCGRDPFVVRVRVGTREWLDPAFATSSVEPVAVNRLGGMRRDFSENRRDLALDGPDTRGHA